jgi:subfamily B ATP-binding cassette protein MsbA
MDDTKRIFHLVKPYWKRVAIAGIISICISGLNASLAWLVKPAIDDLFIRKNLSLLIILPVVVLTVFIIKGSFIFLHEYLMRSAAQKMVMNLRSRLYSHIVKLPMEYLSKTSSGSLMSKVMSDSNILQRFVSLTVKDLFVESTTIIALTGVALYRRWDLTLISLIVLPTAFYGAGRLGKRLKRISQRTQEKISDITEILHESFAGIKIIKAFGKESEESERFRNNSKDLYRESMRSVRVSESASLLMEAVGGLGVASFMWYGGSLVINEVITAGDFFSFITAIFMLYTPAKRLVKINNGIQQARASLQRVFDLFEEEQEKDGIETLESFDKEIILENLSFTYPSAKCRALNNINLTIKKGDVVAIVGKSGSGKTTLINMLPRFFMPDEGTIYIDGHDISTLTLKSLRTQFGIVSQDVILFNNTVSANIKYGKPEASREEVLAAAKAAYADEFIDALPLTYDTKVGERGVRLSGGQRQRLSIARAILKNPPVLILDEATSSLDTESEMMIQKALENLMKNRTTLVIAHRLSTIRKADRIIVMEEGRIIESGKHEELLLHEGIYQNLYELQFRDQELSI